MKKILVMTAAAASLFTFSQAHASSEYLMHKAKAERAEAYQLNAHASALEAKIRHALRNGHNPIHLRHKAKSLRNEATKEAWESNALAKRYYDSLHH